MAKILLVDVDQKLAAFVAGHLRASGHTCVVVDSGVNVLESAGEDPPDLLILEVMMPDGVSGFEICRRVRSDDRLFTVPILLISAMANEEEVKHGLAQGADDYLRKPFDVPNLLQRVESLLRANADAGALDELTALPNANTTKRDVQKRVCRRELFAVAYVELLRVREFAQRWGDDTRTKTIRHLGRALMLCGQDPVPRDFQVGHIGGGHFVCLLGPEYAHRYFDRVMKAWYAHLPTIYEGMGLLVSYQNAISGAAGDHHVPILDLLICITAKSRKDTTAAQDLFDVLTQMRKNALASNLTGIHFDRRALGRGLFKESPQ